MTHTYTNTGQHIRNTHRHAHTTLRLRTQLREHSSLTSASFPRFLPHSGSILASQLSWESGKFQLARWSHEVVLFPDLDHPPTHPQLSFFFLCCAVSPPQLFLPSTKYVRCPPPIFLCCAVSPPHVLLSSTKYVRCPPLPVYIFSVRCPPQCSFFPLWLCLGF